MSKKKDTLLTVAVGGPIPAGHKLQLTSAQADARRHLLTPCSKEKDPFSWKGDGRRAFITTGPTYFKAGEQLALDSELDRGLEIMFGIAGSEADAAKPEKGAGTKKPTKAELAKAFDEGKAVGKTEAVAELEKQLGEAKEAGRTEAAADLDQKLNQAKDSGKAEATAELDAKLKAAKAEGRAEMLAEVEQRNELFDALDAAQTALEGLASDADDKTKKSAQKAVNDAQAAIDALKPLEA